ncbi:glycosyltransferase [Chloroflexota bacterium]
MKILQVTNLFAPIHGGSAEVPYQLSRELARRGHELTIYTSDFRMSREYLDHLTEARIHAFKTRLNLAGLQITPAIVKKAKDDVRHSDIIHLHNFRTFQNIIVHRYARRYSIPYVLQTHGSLTTFFQKGWLKRIFDMVWGSQILQNAARVVAVTRTEAEQCRSMGINDDKISIIPHGIALPEYENLPPKGQFRKKYNLYDNQKVVLYLGRLHKTKGLDLLARAFARMLDNIKDVRLVITGPDDGYLRTLARLVKELKIEDHVLFTGPLYERDKLGAYVDADVHVLPSKYEIFGITVLEALACGTPVIVTDRCGVADIIDRQAGLVVPCDKDRLCDALIQLLGDDNLSQQFGETGRSLAYERFNWEKVARQVEETYREVIE